ncbi:hypothetical protein N658DRAFT_544084 [Parathielavia hyrcaniae]|uniref:Uncharacterized protein n=1 Tax=Parathielavia hyrcaniae TaxID=113614 RepID=A0AAN6PXC0_9PEZI|nr:hypothetical protein N658DRAFT_544084 [Parathielavia hyrcaniae]
MREEYPSQIWTRRDIENEMNKVKAEALGGYTPTQALLKHFTDTGIKHRVRQLQGRVVALIWTYPFCEEMWQRFPDVISIDNTYRTNEFEAAWEELIRRFAEEQEPAVSYILTTYFPWRKHFCRWLGDLRFKISRKALGLVTQQHQLCHHRVEALSRLTEAKRRAQPPDEEAYTGSFRRQFGLTCSHEIEKRLRANKEFTVRDTHEHWRLGKDLASGDLYLPILEPLAVVVRRGRPVTEPEQIPIAAIPRGDNYRRQAAASRQRDPSRWELVDLADTP